MTQHRVFCFCYSKRRQWRATFEGFFSNEVGCLRNVDRCQFNAFFKTVFADRDQIWQNVGLSFIQNNIERTDPKRWQQVSLIQRKVYRMPSTTNSLESTHGHLNHERSRRKNFWKSMFKISNHLIQKVNTFQQNVQHNYNYQKKRLLIIIEKLF